MSPAAPSPAPIPVAPSRMRWVRSLRVRLLLATLAGLAVAMVLAGLVLSGLFREHVQRQFELTLTQQLDQLTARLDFDAAGQPVIDTQALSDPRWQKPYSGLYWQIDQMAPDGHGRAGVLRSRSLWDTSLALQADALADGAVHVHEVPGPQGAPLLALERTVRAADKDAARWRLIVAADLQATQAATLQFTRVLALSLLVLLVLLALASWAQVAVGLRPLKALQRGLQDVQQARAAQLQGTFPAEVQPLVDDFNSVLARNAEVVERARTQAGNLAHALKTPLTVLDQAARVSPADHAALSPLVREQVRVMRKVYAERGLQITTTVPEQSLFFAGEEQDLQEMLGNLLDNACKWARSAVLILAQAVPGAGGMTLRITVEDDGPGIGAEHRALALARGVRLDESVPGTGLGLAIVQDLAHLYGGQLDLLPTSAQSGLRVVLTLPAAPTVP